jgi:LmbE family N-acetylglucosaminyl deacetylase
MFETVLVLAAHPDDEVLGCGGTIAKLVERGATVHVAFIADGLLARGDDLKSGIAIRREAANRACRILGVNSITFDEMPDNRLDAVALLDIIKPVERLISEHNPDTVMTHHAGDLNIDHQRVHQAVVTACRPQPGHPVRTMLFFEVASSTEWQVPGSTACFNPNWYEDISSTLQKKLMALEVYGEELRPWPHPRSIRGIENLARWRGATVGVDAAEAFILGRKIS